MSTNEKIPRLLSLRKAAEVLPLSEGTLRVLARKGQLPGLYVGAAGRKFLVNVDATLTRLQESSLEQ